MEHNIELYSEEAQDILSSIPNWIVRWGITVIFVIILMALLCCHFIKYPDVITAPITIVTDNPPSDLIVKQSGLIENLFIKEGSVVEDGDVLAVINSTARWQDVFSIINNLRTHNYNNYKELVKENWIYNSYDLGELQASFADFQDCCTAYRNYLNVDEYSVKKNQLAIQIKAQQNYLNKLKNQRYWMSEDFALLNNNVNRDSMLRIGSSFKVDDSYNSRGTYTEQQKSKAGVETSLAQTQMQIAQIKQSLSELSIQKEQSEEQFKERIDIAAHKLISQLKLWESNYVIKASTRGKVSLSGFWAENQYISSGQKFASIVPVSKTKIIGRVFVPSYGRGKVKIGQIVNIKLDAYPYMDYGILRGKITSLAQTPDISSSNTIVYTATVELTDNLNTTYKKKIPFIQQMTGQVNIITEEMTLLDQIIRPIYSLFKN